MNVTRRGLLRAAAGAALVAVNTSIFAAPSVAWAIAGVDDAVVGGAVLVLLTLAGYAVSSEVSQATLSAMGYSFSDFASDASNQAAAVTRAIADANSLGVEVNRAQAESAAQAIAAGTGAVGEWLTGIAESGRMSLDGIVNGVGAIPAALWGLIAEYRATALGSLPTVSPSATFTANDGITVGTLDTPLRALPMQDVIQLWGGTLDITPTWAIYEPPLNASRYKNLYAGTGSLPWFEAAPGGTGIDLYRPGSTYQFQLDTATGRVERYSRSGYGSWDLSRYGVPVVSDNVISGDLLPGVDKAADAPETYGAGYDKTIVGADAVYGPTGDVVSAGTIQVPVQYPHVQLPYVDGLYDLGAGVVHGLLDVPIAGDTSIVVGTEQGVVSMPISQAVSSDTSITAAAEPSVPVVPPGTPDVGPWTPAYDLPFGEVWPFNVIYTFVEQLSVLGGS